MACTSRKLGQHPAGLLQLVDGAYSWAAPSGVKPDGPWFTHENPAGPWFIQDRP